MSSDEQAPDTTTKTPPTEGASFVSPEVTEEKSVSKAEPAAEAPKVNRKLVSPAWWKNTYFWLAAVLLLVGFAGLAGGPLLIRDPGQKREDSLVTMLYFVGAVVMVVNGWLSHRQTVRELEEENKNG